MAVINKTGITNGGTIDAEHVTRAIDALSGVSTDTIIATGSFSGSLTGTATTASYVLQAVSSSYAETGNKAITVNSTRTTTNASFYPMLVDSSNASATAEITYTAASITANPSTGGITATSFTGSLRGTASFATTALTASYALNAPAATDSVTLDFFHAQTSNTTSGNKYYIGGHPATIASTNGQIGLVCPIGGTITSAWATSFAPLTASASTTLTIDLYINDSFVSNIADPGLDINLVRDSTYKTLTDSVSAGDIITMVLGPSGNSTSKWNINVGVLIKS